MFSESFSHMKDGAAQGHLMKDLLLHGEDCK